MIWEDEDKDVLHELDWLDEYPAVNRSDDPDVREAADSVDARKLDLIIKAMEDALNDNDEV